MTKHLAPRRRPPSHGLLCAAIAASLALTAPTALAAPETQSTDLPRHDEATRLDRIEVTASPLGGTAEELSRPVEVLAGEQLDAAKSNSLGETVNRLPGVHSSYFGPGVGRPIIRGQDGARVQVLSGGLSSMDVSTVSIDHAVTIEPFLADQIEVLKGPATLLYGSGAIGGAVNVVDGRIPEEALTTPISGRAELRGATVNDERSGMLRLDAGLTDHLVLHVDGMHRHGNDYQIPGFAESAEHLAEEGETPDPDEHEPATRGILENSSLGTNSGAIGLSWVGESGFLGASLSGFDTHYGIPGHAHAHEHEEEGEHEEEEHEEEALVRIDMKQTRGEIKGGIDAPFAGLESLKFDIGRTNYEHVELEGDEVGTRFENTGTEGRIEAVHEAIGAWRGAFGLQFGRRDFEAIGEEAFVPPTQSRDWGLFVLEQADYGPWKLELGARHDRNEIDVEPGILAEKDTDVGTTSLSGALRWEPNETWHLSLGLDRAQRAPTAEELYSNGEHVATQSFEIGDAGLDKETAQRIEFGAHLHTGPLRVKAAVYQTRFDDFIYLADSGLEEHELPIRLWSQADATFRGFEAEATLHFDDTATGDWELRAFGDYVRAELDGDGTRQVPFLLSHGDHVHEMEATVSQTGPLPRIAPARLGASVGWELSGWRASVGAVRYDKQDRVAANERPSDGYTLVDAHLAYHWDTTNVGWEVFLDGSNLTDEEARPHTSFLRDLAPLPGRSLAFGIRAFF